MRSRHQAFKVGFEFLQVAEKAALGGDLIASEIIEEPLMGFGPGICVHGQLPFDFGQAFLRAL
jgi:hypothetical protein